ncbi:MAG: choice-of-anchor Q domain-containing protein [Solirubrobacterales bacterium]
MAIGTAPATADFTVNTTADHANNPALCAPPSDCTLREAITAANALAGTDTITVPAGTYNLLDIGWVQIESSMTIQGAGMGSTIIDGKGGNTITHLLYMPSTGTPVTAEARDLTLQGVTKADGGVVLNAGSGASSLTMTRVAVLNNIGSGGNHAIVQAFASAGSKLSLIESTVAGNSSTAGGSGATVQVGTETDLIVERSAIVNNAIEGGAPAAIGIEGSPTTAEIRNSTISGNSSLGPIILDNTGKANFSYNTIVANIPGPNESVLRRGPLSGWTLKGNVISGNTLFGTGTNCKTGGGAALTSQGFNFEAGSSCDFTNPNDHPNTTVAVGPLSNNGGPTPTHALAAGSPAIDAGGLGGCSLIGGTPLSTDQRGATRPSGPACDSGAYEFNPAFDAGLPKTTTPPDVTPPNLSGASMKPSKFAVNRKGPPETATASKKGKGKAKGKGKKPPKGTTLSYTLSEDARVLVTIQRLPAAAKKGGKKGAKASKVKGKSKGKGKAKGQAPKTVGSFAIASVKGANSHRFSGRIGKKGLTPGKYRALLVATDAAGNRSTKAQVGFKIVRP